MHAQITRFVGRRVRSTADADDIVQQVFLRLHRGLPTLDDDEKVYAWIFRTARNAIADYYRAATPRREVAAGNLSDLDELDAAVATQATLGPDDEPGAIVELARCVKPLLAGLPEADVRLLHLVDVDGATQVDAARQAGISVPGMKSRVQRARARLRAAVEACCRVDLDRRGGIASYQSRQRCGC